MVDISAKPTTARLAVAAGAVYMHPETLIQIQAGVIRKGDVLSVARLAGIMAAKRTSELIPLCHPLPLGSVAVDLQLDQDESCVRIRASVQTTAQTGVEMEALTAASVAALTIYDMAKAIDRQMHISDIRLLEKRGGQSGDYRADDLEEAPDIAELAHPAAAGIDSELEAELSAQIEALHVEAEEARAIINKRMGEKAEASIKLDSQKKYIITKGIIIKELHLQRIEDAVEERQQALHSAKEKGRETRLEELANAQVNESVDYRAQIAEMDDVDAG